MEIKYSNETLVHAIGNFQSHLCEIKIAIFYGETVTHLYEKVQMSYFYNQKWRERYYLYPRIHSRNVTTLGTIQVVYVSHFEDIEALLSVV